MPDRVRLSRAKGWRMPENTVKVDPTTPWGNPFHVGVHGTRAECVHRFAQLCSGLVCISDPKMDVQVQQLYLELVGAKIDTLKGKNLACWCSLDGPCHADVLLALANEPRPIDGSRFMLREVGP